VHLRERITLEKIAPGSRINGSTAYGYTSTVIDLLAEPSPGF
jgi:hypothetical protein